MRLPAYLATIGLVLAAPIDAQDEVAIDATIEADDEDDAVFDEQTNRLFALLANSRESIEGVEPYACPVGEAAIEGDAETPAKEVVRPVQDYEPKPAMWKISDEDTVIHLFGTFHVLPENFAWRTAKLEEVIAESEELVLETNNEDLGLTATETFGEDTYDEETYADDDAYAEADAAAFADAEANAEAAADAEGEGEFDEYYDEEEAGEGVSDFEMNIFNLVFSNLPDKPIFAQISERNKPKLAKMVLDAGMELEAANFVPPMLLILMFDFQPPEEGGSSYFLGVENVLQEEFAANNRPVSSIEDPMEVFASLLKINQQNLIASFDSGLDEWDPCAETPEEVQFAMEHAWAKGDLEALFEVFEGNDPLSQEISRVLLTNRNRQWAAWVKDRMDRPGNLMLAVGAGHMAGPDSLVLMLQSEGLTVERVQ